MKKLLLLCLVVAAFSALGFVLPGYSGAAVVIASAGPTPTPAPSDLETVKEYLLTSAAADFREHQPPLPAKFRNVRLGHAGDTTKSGAWRLCGEFLPSEGGDKAEWTGFATIKTSKYEHYIGSSTNFCTDEKMVWDTGDLSSALKDKFDSTKKKK